MVEKRHKHKNIIERCTFRSYTSSSSIVAGDKFSRNGICIGVYISVTGAIVKARVSL